MSPTQVKALLHRARSSLRRAWDKAEGWALAPVFAIRHLMSERATGEAGRLASLSPSAAPFIVERVAAASAIIVAAALTGLPTTPTKPTPMAIDRDAVIAAPFRSHEDNSVTTTPDGARFAAVAPAKTQAAAAPSQAVAPAEVIEDLVAEIDKALAEKPKPQSPQHQEEEGSSDPIGPAASEGEKTVKKVKKVVNEVLKTVAP